MGQIRTKNISAVLRKSKEIEIKKNCEDFVNDLELYNYRKVVSDVTNDN